MLAYPVFVRSPQLTRMLDFAVKLHLNCQSEELKEYRIGSEALSSGPCFDPRADTIVRAQATRLRAALDGYFRDNPG